MSFCLMFGSCNREWSGAYLADGKPDQKAPLVGRCREAPHAHVYSFDRVTLRGYFLGHEGYLKINTIEN